MKRDGKDISYSDLDLDIDMKIEMEKKTEVSERGGNTLDFYNDEMSRREVEKLVSGRTAEKTPKSAEIKTEEYEPAEAKPSSKRVLKDDAEASSEKVDYSYVVNLLNETQKDEGDRREKEVMTKMSTRKTQLVRAYKIMRLALISVVVIFLAVMTLLITNLQKTKKELETLTASNTTLTAAYSALNIESGGYKDKVEEQQATIESLNNQIEELTAKAQPTQTQAPTQPGNSGSEQQGGTNTNTNPGTNTTPSKTTLPTKYLVKSGDSLWSISVMFYNDGNLYKEIMKANNFKSDKDLKHGVEITIPNV